MIALMVILAVANLRSCSVDWVSKMPLLCKHIEDSGTIK